MRCAYGSPYVAVVVNGEGRIAQACCNHWDCPKCYLTMAKQHKFKMCNGAEELLANGHKLYFWTLTCRGKDLDLASADDEYYTWTNRLLSTCRAACKKQGGYWAYTQVTERQKRGAAHSHLICTFAPSDLKPAGTKRDPNRMVSNWFRDSNVRAGLGPECRISHVVSGAAVSSYISGYLTKHVQRDVFPPKWKRIRYSREWPSVDQSVTWSSVLITVEQGRHADAQGVTFICEDEIAYQYARHRMGSIARLAS